MKRLIALPVAALLAGCGGGASYVHSDTTLGRVVIYRNGVAYFERYARVNGDSLKLEVPPDKTDDFLKSLTVTDTTTGKPAPVTYSTEASRWSSGDIGMEIRLSGPRPHEVRLSYVTDAPSWKPSYRVVLDKDGKVDFQAWAIVDNTSGEDWNNVRLGVGSSSAMSFHFDLHSLRLVRRETLQSNDLFAAAPPSGAPVDRESAGGDRPKVALELSDDALAQAVTPVAAAESSNDVGFRAESLSAAESVVPAKPPASGSSNEHNPNKATPKRDPGDVQPTSPAPPPPPDPLVVLAGKLTAPGNTSQVTLEGLASSNDSDKNNAALDRAKKVRDRLVAYGVDATRLVAVARIDGGGARGGVRVLESPGKPAGARAAGGEKSKAGSGQSTNAKLEDPSTDPIGTSHFESGVPMSVPRGTSTMVSILHTKADGEVVYLYDPESPRGNASFAFKTVRIKNPTESALESGPVSVFGEGRFIGEGLSEPIPPHTAAFVPFALDRQIVVEPANEDRDEISRMLTVQRGIFSAEMQHTHRSTWTLRNRLGERATVYVRHTVPRGYTLTPASSPSTERLGTASLFRIQLEPGQKKELVVEEQAPEIKTVDVRTPAGMDLVRVFLSTAAMAGPLKGQVGELLKVAQDIGNIEQRIATTREQMQEYRTRMDELHAQVVTLRAVRTAGPLMQSLERKLQEVSDKLSKATIEVVALQEKLMIARVRLQDGVADLTLRPPVPS
ncbi:MAG TPA: DUF4139 domain-containing protein [Polyangiaceae bacterium]|nr:DUF4139 domain-containing protein [Polyangiaceae bacterium]